MPAKKTTTLRPRKSAKDRENPERFRSWIPFRFEDEIVSLMLRTHGAIRSRDAMVAVLIGEALDARREKTERKKKRGRNAGRGSNVPKKVRHATAF